MNVRLESNFASDSYRIWVWEREPLRVLRPNGSGGFRWEPFDDRTPGLVAPVTLELPVEVLQALLQEAGKVLPATHATERHLLDAIAIRDRLLALVEDGSR